MEENVNLPFDRLVEACEIINPQNPKSSIEKIVSLCSEYPSEYLVLIYNHFFEVSNSYEILMFLLQKIDKFKDKSFIFCILLKIQIYSAFYARQN